MFVVIVVVVVALPQPHSHPSTRHFGAGGPVQSLLVPGRIVFERLSVARSARLTARESEGREYNELMLAERFNSEQRGRQENAE